MIAITGGATYLDGVEDMLTQVLKVYKGLTQEKIVSPLPDGCEGWSRALEEGAVSFFLRDQEEPEAVEKGEKDQQVFVPTDEPFVAAAADLMNEGGRKLHEYPFWRNKFLSFMVEEFKGSHGLGRNVSRAGRGDDERVGRGEWYQA